MRWAALIKSCGFAWKMLGTKVCGLRSGLAGFFAHIVESADMGMIQGGNGRGCLLKLSQRFAIMLNCSRQEFDRRDAIQMHVFSLIDNIHSSAPKLFLHAMAADGTTNPGGIPVLRKILERLWGRRPGCGRSCKPVQEKQGAPADLLIERCIASLDRQPDSFHGTAGRCFGESAIHLQNGIPRKAQY